MPLRFLKTGLREVFPRPIGLNTIQPIQLASVLGVLGFVFRRLVCIYGLLLFDLSNIALHRLGQSLRCSCPRQPNTLNLVNIRANSLLQPKTEPVRPIKEKRFLRLRVYRLLIYLRCNFSKELHS